MERGEIPLILLPGLGADRRIFLDQIEKFDAIVPPWIEPVRGESMGDYARRLADSLDLHGPCYVGGLSLGGMLAPMVASHLDARACILISTIRSGAELPWYYVLLCRFSSHGSIFLRPMIRSSQFLVRLYARLFGRIISRNRISLLVQFADTSPTWIAWATCALYEWTRLPVERVEYPFPIFHIHGARDRVLPCRRTTPDVIVSGAGHVSSMTHPADVNRFIAACIAEVEETAE